MTLFFLPKCWTAILFLLCNCRATSRRSNMCTCWILHSQQQKGLCAAFLRTTRKKMGLRYQKSYNHLWVERLFYPSRRNLRPAMPKGRNRRPNCIFFFSPLWFINFLTQGKEIAHNIVGTSNYLFGGYQIIFNTNTHGCGCLCIFWNLLLFYHLYTL